MREQIQVLGEPIDDGKISYMAIPGVAWLNNPAQIVRYCDAYARGLGASGIVDKQMGMTPTHVRYIGMLGLKNRMPEMTLSEIAGWFNTDRGCYYHATNVVPSLWETDNKYRNRFGELARTLGLKL